MEEGMTTEEKQYCKDWLDIHGIEYIRAFDLPEIQKMRTIDAIRYLENLD